MTRTDEALSPEREAEIRAAVKLKTLRAWMDRITCSWSRAERALGTAPLVVERERVDAVNTTARLFAAHEAEMADLLAEVERLRAVIQDACEIIEQGDGPRLTANATDRGWSPDISMTEWRTLYATLNSTRSVEATNATE